MTIRSAVQSWFGGTSPASRSEPVLRSDTVVSNAITDPADLAKVLQAMGGGAAASGAWVGTETAQRMAIVASCVRVLSNPIAWLPLVLYRRDGDNRTPALDSPLYRLLHDRPNEFQTAFQFRKLLQRDLLYRGNAYALKVRGFRGAVIELIRMHPDHVTVKQDPATMAVTFTYRRADGRTIDLPRTDVLHLWAESDDGVRGLNPIALHRETIGDGLAMRDQGSRFWSNGAKPAGILQAAGKVTDKKAMREDFEALYGGENAYRTAVLDQGVEYKSVSLSMEDAQYIEARKFNRSEIAGIFGVPPHKVGDLDKATFSNIEHQALEFVTDGLSPWFKCWEQCLERDLDLLDAGLYVRFNDRALLRGDFKSRQEGLQIQRRNGIINANEWRGVEDMNRRADAGGDTYIVEQNMTAKPGGNPPGDQEPKP